MTLDSFQIDVRPCACEPDSATPLSIQRLPGIVKHLQFTEQLQTTGHVMGDEAATMSVPEIAITGDMKRLSTAAIQSVLDHYDLIESESPTKINREVWLQAVDELVAIKRTYGL